MNENGNNYHIPVLFNECIEALNIKPNGIYVDCTFGGGGHSRGILEKLNEQGKLIVFDQDEDALRNLIDDERVLFVPHNFKHIQRFLRLYKIEKVDGVLADLGVSSHQFDEGSRGFSTRFDGPLDMRMNINEALTAKQIIETYTAPQLQLMFQEYGQVTNSKTLAQHIVAKRNETELQTISQFKVMISSLVKGNPNKYLAQVFLFLRIEVNDEVGALKELLQQLPNILKQSGRAAIITFHSLEDRLVKNFFKNGSFEIEEDLNPFSTSVKEKIFQLINKKPIEAAQDELKRNTRSRSAKLRVAEKL
ncbi:MAG: 16S rRNA (cytosine(1402)-N(4))-methyltransferase RsmH [Bacteroidetes bacterium]|nr:16S rRNA (cytosine(1402)-N(4))-methyltransferase RsmH [Bacteroidota bacterium]